MWDTMDVQGQMIRDYATEHGIDLEKIMESAGDKKE